MITNPRRSALYLTLVLVLVLVLGGAAHAGGLVKDYDHDAAVLECRASENYRIAHGQCGAHGCDCGILKRQCADTLKWMRQAEKEGRDDSRAYFEAEYAYQQAGCNLTLGLMLAFGAAAHAAPCGRLITVDNNTENERLVARDVPKWALKQAPDLEANDPIWINHAVCTFCPS